MILEDPKDEVLLCLDKKDGKINHKFKLVAKLEDHIINILISEIPSNPKIMMDENQIQVGRLHLKFSSVEKRKQFFEMHGYLFETHSCESN